MAVALNALHIGAEAYMRSPRVRGVSSRCIDISMGHFDTSVKRECGVSTDGLLRHITKKCVERAPTGYSDTSPKKCVE